MIAIINTYNKDRFYTLHHDMMGAMWVNELNDFIYMNKFDTFNSVFRKMFWPKQFLQFEEKSQVIVFTNEKAVEDEIKSYMSKPLISIDGHTVTTEMPRYLPTIKKYKSKREFTWSLSSTLIIK